MAAQALQTNQTSDGFSSGVQVTGACTVIFEDSTFDNAIVEIFVAQTNTAADYKSIGPDGYTRNGTPIKVNGDGTYYVKAKQSESTGRTNITSVVNQ